MQTIYFIQFRICLKYIHIVKVKTLVYVFESTNKSINFHNKKQIPINTIIYYMYIHLPYTRNTYNIIQNIFIYIPPCPVHQSQASVTITHVTNFDHKNQHHDKANTSHITLSG